MVPVFEKLKEECREEGRVEGREEGRVEGREEGREEGKESSISLFIRNFRALNNSDDSIVELLMKGFNLSLQDAEQRVRQTSVG